jgi:predicted lipoprotein with Yx(FWY)xxD motif
VIRLIVGNGQLPVPGTGMEATVVRNYLRAIGLLIALMAFAACSTPSTATGALINTRHTTIGTVLTTAKGRTMYWLTADTAKKSACTGGCAQYWPPVKGPVAAASGVSLPGKFGTITRSDGKIQATYDGHPLYTYLADTLAGQTSGNAVNNNGGLWYAMTPNGARLP